MKSYKETASAVLERRDECIKRRKETVKFVSVVTVGALCLCLVAVLGFDLLSPKKSISVALGESTQTDSMIDGDAPVSVQSKFSGENEYTASQGESQSGDTQDTYLPYLFINEIDGLPIASGARLYFSKEEHDFKELGAAEITEYFGRELVPEGAVREPLKNKEGASCTLITEKKSGKLVFDTAYVQYANGFYEDGSALHPSESGRNLTIFASRLGKPNIVYNWGDGKYTELKGVKVYAGKMKNGYNYNQNKEPTDFFVTYFAEFQIDGVYYEVTADNLSVDEFIRAVWGIIAY